jgi:transcriptional regulator with XRE-family HTH domain
MATTMTETKMNNTRVGEIISNAMEEQGVSIRDLSVKLETTYEHVRRIVRGEGVPSKFLLKLICDHLGLEYREVEREAMTDRVERKFGGSLPPDILGKRNPELDPIERAWTNLTEEQKHDLVSMAKSWSQRNRKSGKS